MLIPDHEYDRLRQCEIDGRMLYTASVNALKALRCGCLETAEFALTFWVAVMLESSPLVERST